MTGRAHRALACALAALALTQGAPATTPPPPCCLASARESRDGLGLWLDVSPVRESVTTPFSRLRHAHRAGDGQRPATTFHAGCRVGAAHVRVLMLIAAQPDDPTVPTVLGAPWKAPFLWIEERRHGRFTTRDVTVSVHDARQQRVHRGRGALKRRRLGWDRADQEWRVEVPVEAVDAALDAGSEVEVRLEGARHDATAYAVRARWHFDSDAQAYWNTMRRRCDGGDRR